MDSTSECLDQPVEQQTYHSIKQNKTKSFQDMSLLKICRIWSPHFVLLFFFFNNHFQTAYALVYLSAITPAIIQDWKTGIIHI